ncbi:hypothetical protein MMIC_P0718 [Mariprofundus micogutta]|uniref:Uncharacterized protein n=1 Tax=Mariprofundus micogutta TaxID=1921010 RepID=A0A1L8CLI8_9PROT|nr:hypothetical protein [Mariprofundus micogutta]GAV19761.1 hypothetical protein MMIC_P0718 [Mariprofundus micogutta]
MNIMATLNAFKGKQLNDELIQLITSVFDKQNSKLEKLKEQNASLEKSVADLSVQLERKVAPPRPVTTSNQLSEVETAVLSNCIDSGISGFCSEDMVTSLSYGRLETISAIDQLERKGLLLIGPLAPEGTFYSISDKGKKYVHKIENDDYSY